MSNVPPSPAQATTVVSETLLHLGGLDAGGHDRRRLECGVEDGDLESVHRPRPVDDRPAAGRDHRHRVVAQRLEDHAHRQRPAASLAPEVAGMDLLFERHVELHGVTSSSGAGGRMIESSLAGPIGSPFTPTYSVRFGLVPGEEVFGHFEDGVHPDVAATDAQHVPDHLGGCCAHREGRADLLGEDPGVAAAHVAVEDGHLAPSEQGADQSRRGTAGRPPDGASPP